MKHFALIFSFIFIITGSALAQGKIPASISIIDAQSNTLVPANSEQANLFKLSLINLVTNTSTAKLQAVAKFGPGKRSIVITQADPQTNGNAYQFVLQRTFLGTVNIVYTFQYNVDQNKLYFYSPESGEWLEQSIQGDNVLNLNNCQNYGMFNALAPQPAPAPENAQAAPGPADDNADAVAPDTSVQVAAVPPALPDYEQPECPEEGYLWQPGYWAYSLDTQGYYWVPGVWVAPPSVGYLWTPPYWGFVGGLYVFHTGYWGNSIGFYGGIDYGYGYGGVGFVGGDWHEGHFRYNTAIVRVNARFHYTYVDRSVYRERSRERYSFNGRGGYNARPNSHEMAAMHERHVMATHDQIRNQRMAREDKTQFASHNGGRPTNVAAARPPERTNFNNGRTQGGAGGRTAGTPGTNNREGGAGGRQGNTPGVQGTGAREGNTPGAPGAGGTRYSGATPGAPGAGGTRPGGGAPGAPGAGGTRQAGAPGAGGARPGAHSGPPTGAPGGGGTRAGGLGGGHTGGTKTSTPKVSKESTPKKKS